MSTKTHVVIYTKPGCHLCDDAKEAISRASFPESVIVEEINIETDPELLRLYQFDIPVVTINGLKAFKHRLTTTEFQKRIDRML